MHLAISNIDLFKGVIHTERVSLMLIVQLKMQTSGRSRIAQKRAPTPQEGGSNLLFNKIVAENCMKIKRNWTERGRASLVSLPPLSLDPPLQTI